MSKYPEYEKTCNEERAELKRILDILLDFLIKEPVENFTADFGRAVRPYFVVMFGDKKIETVRFVDTGCGDNISTAHIYLKDGDKQTNFSFSEPNKKLKYPQMFDTQEYWKRIDAIHSRLCFYVTSKELASEVEYLKTLP